MAPADEPTGGAMKSPLGDHCVYAILELMVASHGGPQHQESLKQCFGYIPESQLPNETKNEIHLLSISKTECIIRRLLRRAAGRFVLWMKHEALRCTCAGQRILHRGPGYRAPSVHLTTARYIAGNVIGWPVRRAAVSGRIKRRTQASKTHPGLQWAPH